jgi:hypothetical protein
VTRFYMAALIIIILLLGCAKDIIVKGPDTLKGVYNGRYTVITDYGNSGGATTTNEWIDWKFTDYKFYCTVSLKQTEEPPFCDVSGNYKLQSKIIISDLQIVPGVCTPEDAPLDTFNLIRKTGGAGVPDSLFMEQLNGITAIKKIIVLEKDTL